MDHGQYLVLVHILIVIPPIHLYSVAIPILVTLKLISPIVILSEILFLFIVHHYLVKNTQFIFILSFVMALDNRSCERNFDVRLIGGNDTSEGIVEICHGGVWNSFCSLYNFDNRLAATICYQLGYRKSECMNYYLFMQCPFQLFFRC